jgi:hypothetical protein
LKQEGAEEEDDGSYALFGMKAPPKKKKALLDKLGAFLAEGKMRGNRF